MLQFFALMQWPLPTAENYREHLNRVASFSEALEEVVTSHPDILGLRERPDFANLPDDLFPLFMQPLTEAALVGMVLKTTALSARLNQRFVPLPAFENLVNALCENPLVHAYAATSPVWQCICSSENKFADFFVKSEVNEFYHVIFLSIGSEYVYRFSAQDPRLVDLFGERNAPDSLVERVQNEVPLELDPRSKNICLTLKVRAVCERLLGEYSALRASVGADAFDEQMTRFRRSRPEVIRGVKRRLRNRRSDPSEVEVYYLGFEIHFGVANAAVFTEYPRTQDGADLEYLRVFSSRLQWMQVAQVAHDWPMMQRLLAAETVGERMDEVLVVSKEFKFYTVLEDLLDVAQDLGRTDIDVHSLNVYILLGEVNDLYEATPDDRKRNIAHMFFVVSGPLYMPAPRVSIDAFISGNLREPETEECCVCHANFKTELDNEAVVLCQGNFVPHEICISCASACYARQDELRCPLCRRVVF